MSEYIDVQAEPSDEPGEMIVTTNIRLSQRDEPEVYESAAEGEEGSPLAQALYEIPGLDSLIIDGSELIITKSDDVEWHDLIEDVSDVIRDFFL